MERVLVLDQSYQPIRIISWQRAVTLIFLEKAEVIREYDKEIRSAYFSMKIPSVIRFVRKLIRPKRLVKFSRLSVYTRDHFTCQYCGLEGTSEDLTYDHVIPKSRGGRTDFDNIVTACVACNKKKGNMTLEESKMKLDRLPIKPDWMPLFSLKIANDNFAPSCWKDFCYIK